MAPRSRESKVAQLVKAYTTFYGTQRFRRDHYWATWTVHNPTYP